MILASDIIIFLGPPGVGKGTQAKVIAAELNMVHLSTGEMIRDEVASQSQLGKTLQEMGWNDPENLDNLVVQMLGKRLQLHRDKAIILDGFPHSQKEVKGLNRLLVQNNRSINQVVEFFGDEETLIARMLGRYSCIGCNAIYHDTEKVPFTANQCDICQSASFYRRPEDSLEITQRRLKKYQNAMLPIVQHYVAQGLVKRVSGIKPVQDITTEILKLF